MTFSMPSRRNKWNNSWSLGSEELDSSNVGRKLLEKMGWENGQGLGKDNQGMRENPLWKHRRDERCKTGFKSKDESVANEVLPHQNAFENLLDELNSQTGGEGVSTDRSPQIQTREKQQTSKKCVRYKKMARAKDVNNYSIKDFEGIIGKEVTKKNLNLLSNNVNSNKETNSSFVSQIQETSSKQVIVDNLCNLQKKEDQFLVSQKNEETFVESSIFSYDVKNENERFSESGNPKRKKKRRHSKTNAIDDPSALENCSSETIENTSAENADNRCTESGATKCVNEHSIELRAKRKSSRKMNKTSENSNMFSPDHSSQKTEIKDKKKKKKKLQENSEDSNTCNSDYNVLPSDTKIEKKTTYPKGYLCNTKSLSEIRQRSTIIDEVKGVSRKIVSQFDTSVRTSDKSCDLERTETRKEGNELNDDCSTANDDAVKNVSSTEGSSTLIFGTRNNNKFFLTHEERQKIKKHLADNPEILHQVADAFVGSNLMSIKGYGNW